MTLRATPDLERLIAETRTRVTAELSGHMRERIAIALRGSRPSHFDIKPNEATWFFAREDKKTRDWYEEWADRLLACFDVVGIEVNDLNGELTETKP